MPLLQDRVAVITGGTGVLGRAVSHLFVAEGARVAVPYRNDEDAQALRAELGARADALFAEHVDATDGAALTRFIDGAVAVFGHLDALVNVIGGFAGGRPLHETEEATWDHMLDLNLRTVYLACHAAVPHLLRSGRGAIVNVSSRAAVVPAPNVAAYAVSKAGVVTLTSVLALELKRHGITVNAVLPGIIDTPANRVGAEAEAIRRWTKPDEIARVIRWLCSDE
ncbi:MAG TPA: SDR family NAD(P)-dependent oxidoreductase, partial [Chloroflexota bacterium]|nr:SDR family NAD(P)-dependent oxidoreductase [Chloroflexota bacterium]